LPRDWWKGSVLSKARKHAKLTQAELAKRVRVHQVTIARLETGERRPSMRLLQRLAKTLGLTVTELLG